MVASVISTYTSTAYHTCLYLWARNVEVAQTTGQPIQVAGLPIGNGFWTSNEKPLEFHFSRLENRV